MHPMLQRFSLCLFTCVLVTALVSAAALLVAGPRTSKGLDENHDSTIVAMSKTSDSLKPGDSRGAAGAPREKQLCWIFTHLQKSGGSTIRKMLSDAWGSEFSIYDNKQWKSGDGFSSAFGEKLIASSTGKVAAGGYPEALRRVPPVESNCRFFTMFRHPISRMVSAYFYCQVNELDNACASVIVRARDVDLLTFAKHWSNFAVRQFALLFVPADDVIAYARTPEARPLLPEGVVTPEGILSVPGWYLLKTYLERPGATTTVRGASDKPRLASETSATTMVRGASDMPRLAPEARVATTAQTGDEEEKEVPDAQMYNFLEPVQALLSDGYAAVGILEEFNTTLSLFDAALGMPGMNWHHEFEDVGEQNVLSEMKQKKADILEKAWTDPELKRYMRLDLLLYEHAVDVFHQQARSHDLL